MKKIILSLLIITFIGCNRKEEIKLATPYHKAAVQKPQSSQTLETFTEIPEGCEGAGCYFSFNQKDYENDIYIYVSDIDTICFIKKNGQFIKLRLASQKNYDSIEHYQRVFKNDDLELSLDFEALPQNDEETSLFKGSMSIKQRHEPEQKTEIFGYCGC